ncbi:MAG TPA: M67 family metallopeptidase [Pyrinomonadaceae bacterium]|jgi:proteasome lid subunit RPN8/RPN11|nr:M67 family metallopeptidase [Pyrinomonadaceae bacterium]
MLKLDARLVEEIRRHAEEAYPHECCGLLIGRIEEGGRTRTVSATYRVENTFEEGERFHRMAIEPLEYAKAERLHAARGLGVVGNYHSHPDHPAVPSRFDLEHLAPWTTMSYVVVSVREGKAADLRSWELRADRSRFDEEEVNGSDGFEPGADGRQNGVEQTAEE